ncbi:MAG: ABC transporter ATP-binding protein [Desulfomicrobium sp.]|uniref:ABC transporter ATP-binding protein n=1 Tax=Hoeflea sp. TaxID=1940281 RepID=UPI0025BF355C|nr:ABC transporter ATP-binding protein [Hoeflea sp.]MBU4527157.1 ABC transporter ATP-binding protein [Alphaproteobacteria bacterium]MBV1713928.1 ABC transporter ATP-binding protein [Desulfomicrobium sp.]MBU4544139.1 ABC transporter ATP-binding protein [Alphaproteobacteria bacterium]MBU4552339.1 ABC transporter ATP-binding protein [Alphaproteobacteria bacterium]MBV1786200.1 ABC transporter ATP-binding protein [Hoeflea sp.]
MKHEGYDASTLAAGQKTIAEFRNVSKRFGSVLAANDLNLKIAKGEFLSFLGPSGCGKTTALRMLAGFEAPSEGDVLLDGEVVNNLDAHRRPVNMVFQHYALFPHMTVAQNIGYGLKQQRPRLPKSLIAEKVIKALDVVRLGGFENRRIWEMSGGQQQRVALARAIINEPKLLLLDEPLAALDRKLRKEMQIELQNLQRQLGITFVLVTHDQEEALSMSDRICVMKDGRIVQVGSPQELYDRPRNRYVAGFVGSSNFFEGTVTKVEATCARVRLENGLEVEGTRVSQASAGQSVCISVRPEQISLSRTGEGATVKVLNRIFLGEHTEYFVRHETLGEFFVLSPRQSELNDGPFNTGDVLFASWEASAALVMDSN